MSIESIASSSLSSEFRYALRQLAVLKPLARSTFANRTSLPRLMEGRPRQFILRGIHAAYKPPTLYKRQEDHQYYSWWSTPNYMYQRVINMILTLVLAFLVFISIVEGWTYNVLETMFHYVPFGDYISCFVLVWIIVIQCKFVLLVGKLAPIFMASNVMYKVGDYKTLRKEFRDMVVFEKPVGQKNHSHPTAAATRNSCETTINTFIRNQGLSPYALQLSNRDMESGIGGSHVHFHQRHLGVPEMSTPINKNHVFKMINSDYDIQWERLLWMAQPFMLFTFTPTLPCHTYQETSWTVTPDNKIDMSVRGGASYQHPLWDYNVDFIQAQYPGVTIHYNVETNRVNEHWSIVLITPLAVTPADWHQPVRTSLKRVQLCTKVSTLASVERGEDDDYVCVFRHLGESADLAISRPGKYTSLIVPPAVQAKLDSRFLAGKVKNFELTGILQNEYSTQTSFASALVYEAYPLKMPMLSRVSKYNKRDESISYGRIDTKVLFQKEKLTGMVIGSPVLEAGYLPVVSKENEMWTKEKRIVEVHNPQDKFTPRYLEYASEFALLLIPSLGMLAKRDLASVVESQKRPTQRLKNNLVTYILASFFDLLVSVVKAFQKAEVYGSIKDPRNISTLPTEHCLLYSQYTQPLADHLKSTKWYAFGMHPDQVAERVHLLCSSSQTVVETDFSRFDGTHSKALYAMELAILLRCYDVSEHDAIRRIHKSMTDANAHMALGTKYDIGGGRLSGSADTSLMNSIDNAFVAYCVYRRMQLMPKIAYAKLGIYGGDDGISGDADPKTYESVALDLGLKLKAIQRASTARVGFLGRVYIAPFSSPKHMADLPRQLPKLHIHPSRDPVIQRNPGLALYNKMLGHTVTDPCTPILAAWCDAVRKSVGPEERQRVVALHSYSALRYEEKSSYIVSHSEALSTAADMLGISVEMILQYEQHLRSVKHVRDIRPLMDVAVVIPEGVHLGDVPGPTQQPSVGDVAAVVENKYHPAVVASNDMKRNSPPPLPNTPPPPLPLGPLESEETTASIKCVNCPVYFRIPEGSKFTNPPKRCKECRKLKRVDPKEKNDKRKIKTKTVAVGNANST
jgi:hypothetical protein